MVFGWRKVWLVWPVLMCGLVLSNQLEATSPSSIALGWNASPDTNVTGYLLCSGLVTGQYTNQVEVGNATNTTVTGLTTNVTYYFVVIAHDGQGNQAPPSNEVQVTLPAPSGAPQMGIQLTSIGPGAFTPSLNFLVASGSTYQIQASSDLINWSVLWTTNCATSGQLLFNDNTAVNYSQRFYRVLQQ